jgi:hypothetical protein
MAMRSLTLLHVLRKAIRQRGNDGQEIHVEVRDPRECGRRWRKRANN